MVPLQTMATAICGSAHRAAPDQLQGCAKTRDVLGQSPLPRKQALADLHGRHRLLCLKYLRPSVDAHRPSPGRSRDRVPTTRIRTVASVAEKADFAALPAGRAVADFAEADTAVGSEPADTAAGPLPLSHSRPHVVPCQSLLAPCEIRSCFGPGSAPIREVSWHQTRPILLPELVPILTVPELQTRAYSLC